MTAEWGEITAKEIIKPLNGELVSGKAGSVLTGVSTDSRKIKAGNLFLALRGERYDGHDFAQQAIEQGASGVVIEKGRKKDISADNGAAIIEVRDTLKALGDLAGWWRHEHNVLVAAITGSSGKTTTKEMTANILSLGARTIKNEGNLNNLIGLPQTLLQIGRKERRAVLEMGMNRPGEIGRLTEIADPDIGLITNVARVHLEGVGDIMGVARAKAELLERISDKSRVILYGDDDLLMKEALRFKREIITYGLRPGNEIRADKIKSLGWEGTLFDLQYHGESAAIRIKVPGRQNLFNALAAAAIALCVKESFEHIAAGLGSFEGIRGRFMPFSLPDDIILVDDTYNANPYSLRAALDSIKEIAGGGRRLIVGLGEMMELGDETAMSHLEAGYMVAESGASFLFAMGDHAGEMIKGALEKGLSPERAVEAESHQDMARKIGDAVKKGDLILLKGSRKIGLEKVFQSLKERRLGDVV
ncbi:MAG TPA: UDP-N-acetylmuramoyl-tripeptide--D-alanyl-D-alanine ligase [Desulfatiglandales bacterium]|nr:UDP-N-acetylmuramoyl-tripeptide--D-alanyl-D-alanine ligase [Desulfatiglandales bacterium]